MYRIELLLNLEVVSYILYNGHWQDAFSYFLSPDLCHCSSTAQAPNDAA